VTDQLPHLELAQIRTALAIENESRKRGWIELFQTPGMRRRSLIALALGLFTQFSGNGLITNYLKQILVMVGIEDPKKINSVSLARNCTHSSMLGLSFRSSDANL
jgi:hypothetical protein